ncbi:LacI family DNA-binding transcriptional regulator [Luedemannella flava]
MTRFGPVEFSGVKARLADIAAQAGVSEATVSRVLNGKPGVAEGTRDAVLTALDLWAVSVPRASSSDASA